MAHTYRTSTNRLGAEKSPYLLQHAQNPVEWYPWGSEAFAASKAADKPIFLSIGYATCHWCHVMERESFESETTAALLNASFINIKVDREERPDIDRVYMAFVQSTTGHGGWPLSVWLTPALEPIFGGTYFPPERRYGQPAFPDLIAQISAAWRDTREELRNGAQELVKRLRASVAVHANRAEVATDDDSAMHAFQTFRRNYDRRAGGFGHAPKFPRPVVFNLLLRYFARSGDREAAEMTLHTLKMMARGGIHDHLGGGFHRYAVDAAWHVPHFEKMLYDQAQLANSYLDAYQLTGDSALEQVARGVFDYVVRELTDAQGGFYSAEDADSATAIDSAVKREGAFYTWNAEELKVALNERMALFAAHYGVRAEGNADDPHGELSGQNVLHEQRSVSETARELGMSTSVAQAQLAAARSELLALRAARPRPLCDAQTLCARNAMLISAFARGASVLADPQLLSVATRAAQFIEGELYDPAACLLYRRYRAGERAIEAYLDDYVQLVAGLLDLYEASFELRWLRWAEVLTDRQCKLFGDAEHGGFFASSGRDPSVLLRLKDSHDGAEPSGNSLGVCNLLRLAALLDRSDFVQFAANTLHLFARQLHEMPDAVPQLVVGAEMQRYPPTLIVIVGERDEPEVEQLRRACFNAGYIPNKALLLADRSFMNAYGTRLAFIGAMKRIDDQPTAYVCRDRTCQQPTTEPSELQHQLGLGVSYADISG